MMFMPGRVGVLCIAFGGCLAWQTAQAAGWSGVVNFSSGHCVPCQQMAPIVEKLQREGLPIRKVDTGSSTALTQQYNVTLIPAFVLIVDGQEIDREVGAMSEADLRRFVDRVPLAKSLQSQGNPIVDLGDSSTFPAQDRSTSPRPEEQPLVQQPVADPDEKPASGLGRLWPFGKREPEEQIVRGNDVELGAPAQLPPGGVFTSATSETPVNPMAASTRLRVIIGDHSNLGSGTIISSRAGMTLILTCGHIFRGFDKNSKIEVDLFQGDRHTTVVGKLEKYDLESDLGLIAIPTSDPYPMTSVAGKHEMPQVGAQVACIGCSGGDVPTRDQIRVTEIDKYEGANNIECTGVPVQGRSGGGLFNAAGQIVGVCIASDPKEQRGLYSGLLAVHDLLDRCQLSHLYSREPVAPGFASGSHPAAPPPQLAQAASPAPIPAVNLNDAFPMETEGQPVPRAGATPPESRPRSMSFDSAGAEAVVILSDNDNPDQPQRVVIIHQVSPKFLQYLNGELGDERAGVSFNESQAIVEAEPVVAMSPLPPIPRRCRASGDFSPLPIVQRPQKSELAPTTLSRPTARRYVRSAAAR